MIITESVYKLINELCSSLHCNDQKEQLQTLNSKQLKSLKCRMHEILLKTSNNAATIDPNELYFHDLELAIKGESAIKCSAMKECCRLVERDEYFQTEIGQSILAFLLKLRNSSNSTHSGQVCSSNQCQPDMFSTLFMF